MTSNIAIKLLVTICLAEACRGAWSPPVKACLRGNNEEEVASVATLKACQALCESRTNYRCISVDYDAKAGKCHLSSENKATMKDSYTEPCYVEPTQWVYSERVSGVWTRPKMACIRGNNGQELSNFASITDCVELCEQVTSFECLSVEFNSIDKKCHLSGKVKFTAGDDYTAPCYIEPEEWLYSERRD